MQRDGSGVLHPWAKLSLSRMDGSSLAQLNDASSTVGKERDMSESRAENYLGAARPEPVVCSGTPQGELMKSESSWRSVRGNDWALEGTTTL
jgi:hypothetical protein